MKTIFIHVGAGKTGTSAIQEFLNINREKLQKKGLYVPKIGAEIIGKSIAHHRLSGWGKFSGYDHDNLWKTIAQLNNDNVIVSSEIFHSMISRPGGAGYFKSVKSTLANWNVKVVFYIRRQEQWLQSAYEQWVKAGLLRNGMMPDEFASGYSNTLGEQILEFADIFGAENIVVRAYEKQQFKNGDLISDFFSALGIDDIEDCEWPDKNPNPRLSRDALYFGAVANSVLANQKDAQILTKYLKKYSSEMHASEVNEVFVNHDIFSRETVDLIEETNKPIYERIAREFLGRADGKLFYANDPDCGVNNGSIGIEVEDVIRISSHIFVSLSKEIEKLRAVKAEN